MADRRIPNLTLEGVRIAFRNFAGVEGQYNRAGDRNFAVMLPPDLATDLVEQGWNVKQLRPREEGDAPQDYIQVSVSYKARPPRVVLITSRGRQNLTEDEISILDWADIRNVDMILNPYEWTVNGKSGIKAYLGSLYVTIFEDELELKYSDVPDSAQNAIGSREDD